MGRKKSLDQRKESLDKSRVIERYMGGETISQIARSLKISTFIISDCVKEAGIELYKSKRLEVDTNKILELRSTGHTISEIAALLNIGESTLRLKIKQNNISLDSLYFKDKELNKKTEKIEELYRKGFSYLEIADECNTTEKIIARYIKRYVDQSDKRTCHSLINQDFKAVIDNIIFKESSLSKEALRLGVHTETLKRHLRGYGYEVNILALQKRQCWIPSILEREILYGEILGDGHISKKGILHFSSIKYSHIHYLKKNLSILKDANIKFKDGEVFIGRQGREYVRKPQYSISSLTEDYIKYLRDIWDKDGVKALPKDIFISPVVLRHWYYGDGYINKKKWKVSLSTDCFQEFEIDLLIDLLALEGINSKKTKRINENTKLEKKEVYNIVVTGRSNVITFLKYIGPCCIEQMQYKHELPDKFYLHSRRAEEIDISSLPDFD